MSLDFETPPDLSKHLLGIEGTTREQLELILELTDRFAEIGKRPIPKVPALRGRTVASVFFEDSTRTRLSFESAARRLSADTLTFSAGSSSLSKGESLRDTVEVISSYGADVLIVRHSMAGTPQRVSEWTNASVINAGDGCHEHPTQALLDCYTLKQQRGSLDGMSIGIVGDIRHSRVARSNVLAFSSLGAKVTLIAPQTLMPPSLNNWPVEVSNVLDDVISDLDACYLLRMQAERHSKGLIPSLREYAKDFGLNGRRCEMLSKDALILHPGPTNQGVEITAEVSTDPRSIILDQVTNGVSLRMAVLFMLLGQHETSKQDEVQE
ncbi:MAG: aspartate carbamoyltransferase catalytic subunit [Acidimicrobiales bacterium]|jgi:aspartate carbamoyltransferase catalytic subunit|nr:aspartate carbamoyltransferase [Acidimicrobiaceae bacterium]MDG2351219.1 aspartate carbamoyltransferase catalytic subunit [Acidimicrobiales bacterium]MDP6162304.1 aspartate carbamoyltransferase catalytic subunit [Acidimicrobiales bacterium]MDP6286225.1 aspartate carbamoyltransferase catalytic subunit [Acidimicrobiales bacterium]HJO40655.1 aspartate carbamoyltransferase catalytic subunit [Acidimicrobiales bacterium]|tara:strand:- start:7294 stop:8265 length:972 start_codon:yes stop_codon:yes gene_type:complete